MINTLIEKYNNLNGKIVTRTEIDKFHNELFDNLPLENDQVRSMFYNIGNLLENNPNTQNFEIALNTQFLPIDILNGVFYETSHDEFEGMGKAVSSEDIYQMITNTVLDLIQSEKGLFWRKTWKQKYYGIVSENYISSKPYRGINAFLLNIVAPLIREKNGLETSKHWLTFKQIETKNGTLAKGSRGHEVVYFTHLFIVKQAEPKIDFATYDEVKYKAFLKSNSNKINDTAQLSKLPMLKYYKVFNAKDITGINFPEEKKEDQPTAPERIKIAEKIVKHYPNPPKLNLESAGDSAHYAPALDSVTMPKLSFFTGAQEYYATFFHELIHSTGHKNRLKRDFSGKFGTSNYAFEELVAELGALFLCAEAGIMYFTLNNSAAYLKSWQKRLTDKMKKDNKFFFKASSKAQAGTDLILNRDKNGKPAYLKEILKTKFSEAGKKAATKKTSIKKVEKENNKIVGYGLVDNITGEIVATKKDLQQLTYFFEKYQDEKFKDLEILAYEIIKVGNKNKLGKKVELKTNATQNFVDDLFNDSNLTTDIKKLKQIVKESKNIADAYHIVSKLKNIDIETAKAFREKYDPNKKLTPYQAFELFYNEIKGIKNTPIKVNKKTGQVALFGAANTKKKATKKKPVKKITVRVEEETTKPKAEQKTETLKREVLEAPLLNKSIKVPLQQNNVNQLNLKPVSHSSTENHEYFKITGPLANFLGNIEIKPVHSVAWTLDAEQGAGKTRAFFRAINEFAKNYKVLFISAEEHPQSALFIEKRDMYIDASNQNNVYAVDETNFTKIKELIPHFSVVFFDSWNKIAEKNKGVDFDNDLRKGFNGKFFACIFQRTVAGTMRGGSKSQFDGDIISQMIKGETYKDSYVISNKNRYQDLPLNTVCWNIYHDELFSLEALNAAAIEKDVATEKQLESLSGEIIINV